LNSSALVRKTTAVHKPAGSELIAFIEKSDFNRSNRSFAVTHESLAAGKHRQSSKNKTSIGGWIQNAGSGIDRKKLNQSLVSQKKARSRNFSKPHKFETTHSHAGGGSMAFD